MKPRLAHLVQRPTTYRSSAESAQGDYLRNRFKAIREEQRRKQKAEQGARVTQTATVRQMRAPKKGAA